MTADEHAGLLAFLRDAERLKDALRSGRTSRGRRESVAEHSWRLLDEATERRARDADGNR